MHNLFEDAITIEYAAYICIQKSVFQLCRVNQVWKEDAQEKAKMKLCKFINLAGFFFSSWVICLKVPFLYSKYQNVP